MVYLCWCLSVSLSLSLSSAALIFLLSLSLSLVSSLLLVLSLFYESLLSPLFCGHIVSLSASLFLGVPSLFLSSLSLSLVLALGSIYVGGAHLKLSPWPHVSRNSREPCANYFKPNAGMLCKAVLHHYRS